MNDVNISIITAILSIVFEYIAIRLLLDVSGFSLIRLLVLGLAFPILFLMDGINAYFSLLASIIEGIIFYFLYQKDYGKMQTVTAIFLINILSYLIELFRNGMWMLLKNIASNYFVIIIYLSICLLTLMTLKHRNPIRFLDKYMGKVFLYLEIYIYVTLMLINYLNLSAFKNTNTMIFLDFIMLAQIGFACSAFIILIKVQKEKDNIRKEKISNFYVKSLEEMQKKLYMFRHRYNNYLNLLKNKADNIDKNVMLDELQAFTNDQLNNNLFWKFQDINNILDLNLKNTVISKLNQIYQLNYKYKFECPRRVDELSKRKSRMFSKIIETAYDTSIHVAKFQNDMGKVSNEIDSLIYRSDDNEVIFEISGNANTSDRKVKQELNKIIAEIVQNRYDIYYEKYINEGHYRIMLITNIN